MKLSLHWREALSQRHFDFLSSIDRRYFLKVGGWWVCLSHTHTLCAKPLK